MNTNQENVYQIELRLDVGNGFMEKDWIPHSFIAFTINDNPIAVHGFAPAEPGKLVSDGKIYDDSDHEKDNDYTKVYTVSEEDFYNALNYSKQVAENPPEYNLPFGAQCATHANNVLAKANVDGYKYIDMGANNIVKDIYDTATVNPYTQGSDTYGAKIQDGANQVVNNIQDSIAESVENLAHSSADDWFTPEELGETANNSFYKTEEDYYNDFAPSNSSNTSSGSSFFQNYWNSIKNSAKQAVNNIQNAWNTATEAVQSHVNQMQNGAVQAGNDIHNALDKAVEAIQNHANQMQNGAAQAGDDIQNAWNDYWNRTKDGAEQMSNNIRNNVQNHIDRTQDGAVQAGNDIHNALDKAVEAIQNHANQMQNGAAQAGDDIQNAWNDYWNRAKDGAEQMGNDIQNARNDYWNRAKDGLEQMSNDFRNYLEKMKESLEKATQNPEENNKESASSKDGADANNPNNPSNEQDHSGSQDSENAIPSAGGNVCKNPNPAAASAGGFGKGFGKGGSYDPFNPYTPYYDPLLISLNGNSKSDIYVNSYDDNSHTTMLDLNGDGIANKVSWIGKNTGILFLDENNNNQMDGFQELLSDGKILENGETSKNGFDYALNVLDTDGNKVLNADDEKFNQIKVLSFNEDNEEQIHTLTGLDIQSLNLNYANVALSNQHLFNNVHGENLVLQESAYTKANGATGKLVDVDFSYDTIHTQYIDEIALNDEQSHTANLQGYGYLRDLNQAASLSKDLHHQLNEYSQLSTKDEQLNHLDSLLKSWAQTSPYYSNEPIDIQSKTFYRNEEFFQNNQDVPRITASQANVMQNGLKNLNEQLDSEQLKSFNQEETQDKLHILQSFYGINHHTIYLNKPDELEKIIDNIDNDYAALKEDTYQHLLFQTRLKPYLQETEIDENEHFHFEKVAEKFNEVFNTLPEKALIDLSEFLHYSNLGKLNPEFNQQFATFYEQTENAETLVDQETAAQIIHANHEVSLTDETAEIILLGNVIDKDNFAKIESIAVENEDDWAIHDTEIMPDWRDIEGDDEDEDCLI